MRIFQALILVAGLLVTACGKTTAFSTGSDFPSGNIVYLVKGKTTEAEVRNLFGEPFVKSVVSPTEEKWKYVYAGGTTTAKPEFGHVKLGGQGYQKVLDLFIQNGVVVNFTFSEAPLKFNTVGN